MNRLLYVDDAESQRKLVRLLLDSMDEWTLVECSTAEEALQIVATAQPDVIALDFRLPGMSGIRAARRLRSSERTRSVPLIAVSGHDASEMMESQDERALFDVVLRKPFDVFRFKEIIENLCRDS